MKKLKYIPIFFFAAILFSCEDDDATLTQDLQNVVERGAVLRTLETVSSTYNAFDTASEFEVVIQAQDAQDGRLMASVDVFLRFDDRTPDNGSGNENDRAEQLVRSIPASEFTIDQFNLPRTTINLPLSQALSTFGMTNDDFTGGDRFIVRLALNLTDGRVFTEGDANASVGSGSFFRSPFVYFVDIACIPLGPVPGTYVFDMVDSYGDGWNGGFLTVTIDGVSTDISVPEPSSSTATETFVVPEGTTEFTIVYTGGDFDDENSFTITRNGTVVASASNPPDGEVILSICPDS